MHISFSFSVTGGTAVFLAVQPVKIKDNRTVMVNNAVKFFLI